VVVSGGRSIHYLDDAVTENLILERNSLSVYVISSGLFHGAALGSNVPDG
jgi:hypothetical protein